MIIDDEGKLYQVVQVDIVDQLKELEKTSAMVEKGDAPAYEDFETELSHLIQKWEVDTHAGVGTKILVEMLMRLVKAFEYQKAVGLPADPDRAVTKLAHTLMPENQPLTND